MIEPWTILHSGALGDLALAIQLALRAGMAQQCGSLTLVSRTNPGDLSQCNPTVARRSIEGLGAHWLHATDDDSPPELLRDFLHRRRVLNFLAGPGSRVHTRLLDCGCRVVLGIDPRPDGSTRHILDQWQSQIEKQGFLFPKCTRTRGAAERTWPSEEMRSAGLRRFREAGGAGSSPVLIHPGSGGAAKCWPLSNFKLLAEHLLGARTSIAWVIGPVESERWPASIIQSLQRFAPLLRPDGPNALVELLAGSSLLVANDNGPGHLAALLGTPTVSIFGSTDSQVWKPKGPRCAVFQGVSAEVEQWGIDPRRVSEAVVGAMAGQQSRST